jgi:hypothetical protein
MKDNHYEGFEKERRFHIILGQALSDCPVLKARTVKRIIAHVAPEFLKGLFERRPCTRKLKYIGCGCEESVCPHGEDFFEIGEIYESIDFTGATYSIHGYGNGTKRIGSGYFEGID